MIKRNSRKKHQTQSLNREKNANQIEVKFIDIFLGILRLNRKKNCCRIQKCDKLTAFKKKVVFC